MTCPHSSLQALKIAVTHDMSAFFLWSSMQRGCVNSVQDCAAISSGLRKSCPSMHVLKLKDVVVDCCLFEMLGQLRELHTHLPNLRKLPGWNEMPLAGLSHLQGLQKLVLPGKVTDLTGVSALPHLTHLEAGMDYGLDYEKVSLEISRCPKLSSIVFHDRMYTTLQSATLKHVAVNSSAIKGEWCWPGDLLVP